MARFIRIFAILAILAGMSFAPGRASAADEEWCPVETGFCAKGDFLFKWKGNPRPMFNYGYPMSEPTFETLEDGTKYWVQYFQRGRMELHPDAPPAYRVQFGLLGAIVLSARPAVNDLLKAPEGNTCEYRFTTNKCVGGDFRTFYEANGGLEVFGMALTNATHEKLDDGQVYWVQYFERVRLELHPESPDGYKVQLGLFGTYFVQSRGGGYGSNNPLARCLNTEETHTDPNAWWAINAHAFVIGTAWHPSIQKDGTPMDFAIMIHPSGNTEMRVGGKTWRYDWSCGPTAMVDYKQIKEKFPEKGLQELMDLGLARNK
jgi:hypothetical protein